MGMDLVTNPAGRTSWIHGDVLHSHRDSINDDFIAWERAGFSEAVYSEGGVCLLNKTAGNSYERFLYTSNHKGAPYDIDIWEIQTAALSPGSPGDRLPNFPNTDYAEDNPCIEEPESGKLILMFDSNDYPGGMGSHDIWYSQSNDSGSTWSVPANLSSVNTVKQDHQPHLYKDTSGEWWLYFSADDGSGKLAIFRSRQMIAGNWNSWGSRELVVGAGNTGGVGEPTLTERGDISFVVVYDKGEDNPYDRFDADPWFLHKK